MKNILYYFAAILITSWAVIYFGFQPNKSVPELLIGAGIFIMIRFIYHKQFANVYK